MSNRRLVKVTDTVWVDPFEVVALNAERAQGGTRIHLHGGDSVHTTLPVDQVLDALGRTGAAVSGL